MNTALHYSVTCAEDVPRVGLGLREQTLRGKRSARLARMTLAICDVWAARRAPIDAFVPVRSEVPALILSGGLDPVTPPPNGEAVAKTLPNHKHVVAPGYGHIVSATRARRGSSLRSSPTAASRRCPTTASSSSRPRSRRRCGPGSWGP
jgi:pimeloyl-ACP methyl ester carboxylesterase